MQEMLLLKCGELVLKGLNRNKFEKCLIDNIRSRLKKIGDFETEYMQSTFSISALNGSDIKKAYEEMQKIFGINSLCLAAACEKDMEQIKKAAAEYFADKLSKKATFKVEAKRADKKFPLKSPEISALLGEFLIEKFPNISADMENPNITITVEIRDKNAFIHADAQRGAGGMPVGSNGRAALLLSGGIDSPVAGYMMARRGLSPVMVHFFSYPYTSVQARDKVIELARLLTGFTGNTSIFLVPFTKIQEELRKHADEELFTVIMRRFMMKIACQIARNNNCGGLITGESLGQVASQTMEAITVTEDAATLPVFRPLIGMDKDDIVKIAREIGTFDTSVLPYEDCCTVFTPKHPTTKPKLNRVLINEQRLDAESLINEAVSNTERLDIYYEC